MTQNHSKLLSAAALARRLDISQPTLSRAIKRGVITPTFRTGRSLLFEADQLPEIRQKLNAKSAN